MPLNRIERILATMAGTVGGLSLLAVAATLIGGSAGGDLSGGIWPTVVVLPFPGLLIAVVLINVFFVLRVVRRRRLAQDGGQ